MDTHAALRLSSLAQLAMMPAILAACAHAPYPHRGHEVWPREQITCSSNIWEMRRCAPDWRDARRVATLSLKVCRRGEDWGVDGRGLWVDHGCRGRFERLGPGRGDDGHGDGDIAQKGAAQKGAGRN